MNKIQFYPSDELFKAIKLNANNRDISVNALVCECLNSMLCDTSKNNSYSEGDITQDVFAEIEEYISNKDEGYEFDLISASKTFANCKNKHNSKTKSIRAKIGNNFSKKIGKDKRFKNVGVAVNRNGNIKRNKQNAIIYQIIKFDERK